MPKRTDTDDTSEDLIEVEIESNPRLTGDLSNPINSETGQPEFDDISPRLQDSRPPKAAEPEDEDEEDEDEEEEADEEAEAEPDHGEERAPQGKRSSFQKRLERADRLIAEERANSAELRARLERLEQTQTAAQKQAEDAAYAEFERNTTAQVATLERDLEVATEAGETKKAIAIQRQLSKLDLDLRDRKREHETKAKAPAEVKPAPVTTSPIVRRKVDQWKRKHPRYESDPVFKAHVNAVDKEVANAGYDAETDEYYAELDRRLADDYPKEFKVAKTRKEPPTVATQRSGAPARKEFEVRNGRVRLTGAQVNHMKTFQLDPTNPEDVKAYVLAGRTSGRG